MASDRILVVDDDPLIRGSLYELLRGQRFDVEMASDGAEAMEHLQRRPFSLVLADWKMPQVDGFALLDYVKANFPHVNVILITGFASVSSAVEAIRQGAFDYLTKPIQPEELEATVQRALATATTAGDGQDPFADIVGEHSVMQKLFGMIRAVAGSPTTILLEGESGTGKRVVAQAIHRADPKRCQQPFVEISCGALPETLLESELFGHVRGAFTGAIRDKQGRFELADGGTIFLDEIDAFSPALQVKLLRVLQERVFERVGDTRTVRVDVRVITATNQRLADLVKRGKFREDLYYRLNVIAISLPPLRERQSDIPLLAAKFLERSARAMGKTMKGISADTMTTLTRYGWPGNVRELENTIERAVVLSQRSTLELDDLPDGVRYDAPSSMGVDDREEEARPRGGAAAADDSQALRDALRTPERELILKVLAEVRWNRSEAAKRLGIHRSTLYHKLRQLGIDTK